jgi:hypothetical protein
VRVDGANGREGVCIVRNGNVDDRIEEGVVNVDRARKTFGKCRRAAILTIWLRRG